MSDAILFVGHEESTGAVISVGGVTVLGLRGAYTPPIRSMIHQGGLAARKPHGPTEEIPVFPPSIQSRPSNSPLRATIAIPTHSMFDFRMR